MYTNAEIDTCKPETFHIVTDSVVIRRAHGDEADRNRFFQQARLDF